MRSPWRPAKCVAVVVATLAIACGSPPIAIRPSPQDVAGDETRELVAEAHALERELERLGLVVHGHRALGAYLQSVGERVAARARGSLRPRIAVLFDPSANALALPNGAIYVHTGLLARLENEAQLAQVLAHELSHVVRGHRKDSPRLRARNDDPGSRATPASDSSITASLGAAGPPMFSGLSRPETRSGGSEREREADLDALRAMSAAGYRTGEAARLYALLDDEDAGPAPTATGDSHPPASDRARAMESARAGVAPGRALHADAYLRATREIVLRNVRLCLERRLYRRALEEAGRSRRLRGHDPRLDALEAEARRRLADAGPVTRGRTRRGGAGDPARHWPVDAPAARTPLGTSRVDEERGASTGATLANPARDDPARTGPRAGRGAPDVQRERRGSTTAARHGTTHA